MGWGVQRRGENGEDGEEERGRAREQGIRLLAYSLALLLPKSFSQNGNRNRIHLWLWAGSGFINGIARHAPCADMVDLDV